MYLGMALPTQAATTLVTMNDTAMLERNIDAVCRPLTEKEREVRDYVIDHYFKPLKQNHWEGVEVAQYWKQIKATK